MWPGDFSEHENRQPLVITWTFLRLSAAGVHDEANLAHGYRWDNETQRYAFLSWVDPPAISGAGSVISTAEDYAKYLYALMKMIPPMSQGWMTQIETHRSVVLPSGDMDIITRSKQYSVGWQIINYWGNEIVTHNGALPGFGATMAFIPSKRWATAIFGNTNWAGNALGMVLLYHLIDDLVQIPENERFDRATMFKEREEEEACDLLNSRARESLSLPGMPLPPTLPLTSYCGNYHHPAYQNILLSTSQPSVRILLQNSSSEVLYADVTKDFLAYSMYLEHVTGEHFLALSIDRTDGPPTAAHKAEFRISADGIPRELGLDLEKMTKSEKIWYTRLPR